jgi:hypothetical protein
LAGVALVQSEGGAAFPKAAAGVHGELSGLNGRVKEAGRMGGTPV